MPLNDRITSANEKVAFATEKAEAALKALQACGLEAFDTESVAKSLKTITDNKMNLEKAESEKLGSI